jgi:hypothetical protein
MLDDILTIIGAISFFSFVVISVYAGLCYLLPSTPALATEKVSDNWELCPGCGVLNNDNWPLTLGTKTCIFWGGCQDCWELELGGIPAGRHQRGANHEKA